VSSSQNEVVPHINIRSPRVQPGKFVIGETKRLLQHYLPTAEVGGLDSVPSRRDRIGPVAVMMATIVVPAGARSIARMRACLVSGRVADFEGEGAVRVRDLALPVSRAAERVADLALDLSFMGSSEVHATPSAAPPQPRPSKHPAGQDPKACLSRPKSPQQCSDRTRKPVNSEQDYCSINGSSWLLDQQFESHSLRHRTVRLSSVECPKNPQQTETF
jgi:hypothetical protein